MGKKKCFKSGLYNLIPIIVFCVTTLSSCAQSNIQEKFKEELAIRNNIAVKRIDTITQKMKICVPITDNSFAQRIFDIDKSESLRDPKNINGIITYKIMTLSDNFISVVKTVYVEDSGSPRGFYIWDNCLNFFSYGNAIYSIEYKISDIGQILQEAVKKKDLDVSCLKEEVKNLPDQNFYFKSKSLYVHNPINSPFCDVDIEMPLKLEFVNFKKL